MSRSEALRDQLLSGGYSAVERLIGQSESMYLECKGTCDRSQATLDHFAKTASAFLNTEGGVLLWGVRGRSARKNRSEYVQAVAPVPEIHQTVEWLRAKTSGIVVPAPKGIEHFPILSPGSDEGVILTWVPASDNPPHRSSYSDGVYFLRSPSSSFPMPHGVLAGLFGRRPAPALRLLVAALDIAPTGGSPPFLHLRMSVRNCGEVHAAAPFLLLRELPHAGENHRVVATSPPFDEPRLLLTQHRSNRSSEFDFSATSASSTIVAPGDSIPALDVRIAHVESQGTHIRLEGRVGAASCPTSWWRIGLPSARVHAAGNRFWSASATRSAVTEELEAIAKESIVEGMDWLHDLYKYRVSSTP
jgi:hypothetical protein